MRPRRPKRRTAFVCHLRLRKAEAAEALSASDALRKQMATVEAALQAADVKAADVAAEAATVARICMCNLMCPKLTHDFVENRDGGRIFWASFTHTCSDHPKNRWAQKGHRARPKS